jgi:hypothetical protein
MATHEMSEIETIKQDTEVQHVEDGASLPKWSEIKMEAERDEAYQRSLGLFPSLRIYRAVCSALDIRDGD